MQALRTALLVINSDARERGSPQTTLDPQIRSMLQWVAASVADVPQVLLSPDRELQQVIATFTTTERNVSVDVDVSLVLKVRNVLHIVVSWFPLQLPSFAAVTNHQLLQGNTVNCVFYSVDTYDAWSFIIFVHFSCDS